MAKEFRDKDEIRRKDLPHYFESEEFNNDEVFLQLTNGSLEKLTPVASMAIALNNVYMDLVPLDRLTPYTESKVKQEEIQNLARNIMQPIYVAYQTKAWGFSDSYSEMWFSRGVANIGAVNLLINSSFLDYLTAWKSEFALAEIAALSLKGTYEGHLREVIKRKQLVQKPAVQKYRKTNFDYIVQGINVTVLDDIYKTNLPIVHTAILPISASMIENSKYSGYKDIGVTVEASFFNYSSHEWEPILENFTLILDSYVEQEGDKVSRTNLTFGDRNPAINMTTEFYVLLNSLMAKLNQPKATDPSQKNNFSKAIKTLIQKSWSKKSSLSEFDQLAVLDKQKIYDFIRRFEMNQCAERTSNHSMMPLENTRLYGYDEVILPDKSYYQTNLNRSTFQDVAGLRAANPLNFRFNSNIADLSVRDNSQSNSRLGASKRADPTKSYFKSTGFQKPDRAEVELLRRSSEEQSDLQQFEAFLREVPFRLENLTGRDIIFSITFFEMPKKIYVKNQDQKDMEYPFTLENTLFQGKFIKSKTRNVFFQIYEVDEQQNTMLLHQGSDIHSIKKVKISYCGGGSGEAQSKLNELRYVTLDISPLIMKKNILLKSSVFVLNDCHSRVLVYFFRGDRKVHELAATEGVYFPVPVDLLDTRVLFEVEGVNHAKQEFLDLLAVMSPSGEPAPREYAINPMFSLNLYVVQQDDFRYLHFTPILVLKNMFFIDLEVKISRESMGRVYKDVHKLATDEKEYEIFTSLNSQIEFSVCVSFLESEEVKVSMKDIREKEQIGTIWMKAKDTKKFTLNYSLLFVEGSYLLTIYCQHIVFDELFKSLIFSQRSDLIDDALVDLESLKVGKIAGQIGSFVKSKLNIDQSLAGVRSDGKDSRIFLLPQPQGPLRVSDRRDRYELSSISTSGIGDSTFQLNAISTKTNVMQHYEIVASNSIFKLCTRSLRRPATRNRDEHHERAPQVPDLQPLRPRDHVQAARPQRQLRPVRRLGGHHSRVLLPG